MKDQCEIKYIRETAKRLKEEREAKRYKQHEIAEKIGVGLEHYQKMESGKKRIPLWRIQLLEDDPEIDMDLNYVIFGSQEDEDSQKDDVKEEFYALVRRNQEREKRLLAIVMEYITRILDVNEKEK